MANKLYDIFNALSATFWLFVIYVAKDKWTFNDDIHFIFILTGALIIALALGSLSLLLARYLGKESPLATANAVEGADSTFLPIYTGYFLIAFSVSCLYQLAVAYIFIFTTLLFNTVAIF